MVVKSSDNLGLQGALPTHQKLLDWLAVDFRENNWDLHRLIRNIVLSATYANYQISGTILRIRIIVYWQEAQASGCQQS